MGNGAKVSYTYDDSDRLITKEDTGPGDEVIASYNYTLDKMGNPLSIDMDQPLLPNLSQANESFTYNEANQLVSGNGTTYTYDGKGNRTEKYDGSITTQYAYDHNDMLTRVSKGSEIDEYLYNSDGHRLSAVRNGIETRYLLDINGGMENILAELTDNNTITKFYIYGDGLLYSVDATSGERLYYHYDSIGSTIALY